MRACMEDLDSESVGALTLSLHKVGAPDVGTIDEAVDVVYTNFDEKDALECLVQSMYAYVGEAPEAPLDRVVTRTMALGTAEGGVVEDSAAGPSYLPSAVVDSITTATKRWPFPRPLAGQTFTHSFTLPIPAP